jgi:Ca2+-binding EF-hand superfamily protein
MVNTLKVLKRLEDRKRMGLPAIASTPAFHQPPAASNYSLSPEAREILVEIFQKADTDCNGRLSWSEFKNALHWIGDDL